MINSKRRGSRNILSIVMIATILFITFIGIVYGLGTSVPPITAQVVTNTDVLNPETIVNNTVIINITNNITNIIYNNITNNVTTINNITNNVSFNYSSYYYSGWLTIINNVTTNITNNFSYYAGELTINITNNISNTINVTNNITSYVDNYITNNITTNVTIAITNDYTLNISIENNVSTNISLNIFNITQIYNNTYYYNDTALFEYCDGRFNESINLLNMSYYGELSDYDITLDTLTLTTQNVYYNITSYPNGLYYSGWYKSGDTLVCNNSGLYELEYSMVFSNNVAGQNLIFSVFLNDNQLDKSLIAVKTSQNELYTIHKSLLYNFNQGDVLNIRVKNTDSSGKVITFTTKDLHVTKIR